MSGFQPPFTADPATGLTGPSEDSPSGDARTRLAIDGMTCQHCFRAVESALGGVEGMTVHGVEIGGADVSVDPGTRREDAMAAARVAVEAEGYTMA